MIWFVRVVEAGSFAEAARRAGTTTSALSKAIARFERDHRVRLLHRTTHSLSLTEEGDRVLAAGRQLLGELERTQTVLSGLAAEGTAGRVRLCAPPAFARACILPHLPGFLEAYPDIAVELMFTRDIVDLAGRGIDAAITASPVDGLPGHVARPLTTFTWIACAAPAYLAARDAPLRPGDLTGHRIVGYRNQASGQVESWRFVDPNTKETVLHPPRPHHVFDDGEAAWAMIRSGFGIGWVPSWLAGDALARGTVREVLAEWRAPPVTLHVLRPENRNVPERLRLLLAFLDGLPAVRQAPRNSAALTPM